MRREGWPAGRKQGAQLCRYARKSLAKQHGIRVPVTPAPVVALLLALHFRPIAVSFAPSFPITMLRTILRFIPLVPVARLTVVVLLCMMLFALYGGPDQSNTQDNSAN